jgi:phenylacetate-CoA ligase
MKSESVNEQFHRLLLTGVQRLRGRPLASYIRTLREWEQLDRPAFDRLRADRLASTLAYAKKRVPLYSSSRWAHASGDDGAAGLLSWPVLDRDVIQSLSADLLAGPTPRGHYVRRTAGSTGAAVGIGMDAAAAAWAWATDYRGLLWHGIPVGARCLYVYRQRENPLAEWIRNRRTLLTSDLSPARLTQAVEYLQRQRPTYVSGYVSAVAELARHAKLVAPEAVRPLVPFVKVFGEMLHKFQRHEIEEGLGARVIETYGCSETGTVGYECPAGSLHIFSEHVEVEILQDGKPVEPGECGDIVLTCTTNSVMPLIRYRVGDRGRLSVEPCACGRPHPWLAGVEGRVGDVLLTSSGIPVHGTSLGDLVKAVSASAPTAIGRILFQQEDLQTWTVMVQAGPGFSEGIAALLVDGIKTIFGADCKVTVEVVPEIRREPSGKFRFYRAASAKGSLSRL